MIKNNKPPQKGVVAIHRGLVARFFQSSMHASEATLSESDSNSSVHEYASPLGDDCVTHQPLSCPAFGGIASQREPYTYMYHVDENDELEDQTFETRGNSNLHINTTEGVRHWRSRHWRN